MRRILAFGGLSVLVVAASCSTKSGSAFEDPAPPATDANGSSSGGPKAGGDGGTALFSADASVDGPAEKPCVNLCAQRPVCPAGVTTSISGVVRDPAGKDPLYNVVVYVPNAPLDPIHDGATCEACGTPSGDPLAATLTDANGKFTLPNVPAGANIPLVLQIGKWRRMVTLPTSVQPCVDNPVTDPNLTRLPKNQSEGNIPKIALTTGGADALECLLRKIGVEDSEFTPAGGSGRVHLYAGSGDNATDVTTAFDGAHGGEAMASATDLWSSAASLSAYDVVLLSCEGNPHPETKPQAALDALLAYTSAGGRVFASHWQRYWFDALPASNGQATPFQSVGSWNDRDDPQDPANATLDVSFPKGQALHDWLAATGALTGGFLPIAGAKHNIDAVAAGHAQSWITLANDNAGGQTAVQYLSFNTPQPAPEDQKCGRVVYSDLHVSSGVGDTPGPAWPSGCSAVDLSPQEKALEFMLFDLSSCIQNDTLPPVPPAVK